MTGATLVRVGDGTGEARLEWRSGEECRIVYRSGAKRALHVRNLAPPGEPTPAERELLQALADAGDAGLRYPPTHLRTAVLYLIEIGLAVEDARHLTLTAAGRAAADRIGGNSW